MIILFIVLPLVAGRPAAPRRQGLQARPARPAGQRDPALPARLRRGRRRRPSSPAAPSSSRPPWLGEAVNIRLALDGFSLFMLVAISLVGLAVSLFSIDYMEHYGAKANYYALLPGHDRRHERPGPGHATSSASTSSSKSPPWPPTPWSPSASGRTSSRPPFKYLMLSVVASAFVLGCDRRPLRHDRRPRVSPPWPRPCKDAQRRRRRRRRRGLLPRSASA
ncbi:MAG: hypothetical protein MZU95_13005 [Desulfomicrobium escambiense]|nr:hypothetical protein [Desulfomicrobium escambiense]